MNKITAPLAILWMLVLFSCEDAGTQQNDSNTTVEKPAVQSDQSSLDERKVILFFGNSLSAAHGIDPEKGFVGLTAKRIDSLGLPYKVINAGLSGETTAGGKTRIDWILRQPIDIFILELGGNDALRGIDPDDSYKNLKYIIEQVIAKYPDAEIVIAGMEAPPNMGADYTEEFRQIFPRLAEEFDAALIPFLLEGVGGVPSLNLPDGIHPNAEGHKIVAENVWAVLEGFLEN